MPKTYTPITESEMDEFMTEHGFQELDLGNSTKEKVYGKRVAHDLSVRIYSSIAYGGSRDCGKDAIRIAVMTRLPDGTIKPVGKSTRTYRIETWRKNLAQKIESWNTLLGGVCPRCDSHTVHRSGKYGDFYGCVTYPLCKGVIESEHT